MANKHNWILWYNTCHQSLKHRTPIILDPYSLSGDLASFVDALDTQVIVNFSQSYEDIYNVEE